MGAAAEKLRKRRDFLDAARGVFRAMPLIVIQMRARGDDGPARIGFTTTKRIGKAVIRNRARRRMREAARRMPDELLMVGHDYVFIARDGTAVEPFSHLKRQTIKALEKLRAGEGYPARKRPARKKSADTGKATKGTRP